MVHGSCSTCGDHSHIVVENGWHTCMMCGEVLGQNLDQRSCSFHAVPTHALRPTYTRMKRFRQKIMGGLQRRLNHSLDMEVLGLHRRPLKKKESKKQRKKSSPKRPEF